MNATIERNRQPLSSQNPVSRGFLGDLEARSAALAQASGPSLLGALRQRQTLAAALEGAGQLGRGAVTGTVGAPVDAMSILLRGLGLPIPEAPVGGSDWFGNQMAALGIGPVRRSPLLEALGGFLSPDTSDLLRLGALVGATRPPSANAALLRKLEAELLDTSWRPGNYHPVNERLMRQLDERKVGRYPPRKINLIEQENNLGANRPYGELFWESPAAVRHNARLRGDEAMTHYGELTIDPSASPLDAAWRRILYGER